MEYIAAIASNCLGDALVKDAATIKHTKIDKCVFKGPGIVSLQFIIIIEDAKNAIWDAVKLKVILFTFF